MLSVLKNRTYRHLLLAQIIALIGLDWLPLLLDCSPMTLLAAMRAQY